MSRGIHSTFACSTARAPRRQETGTTSTAEDAEDAEAERGSETESAHTRAPRRSTTDHPNFV